jgi:hypothetical protein
MFLRAAREAVPEVCERLARAVPFFETDAEAWTLHQAYALIPRADFSRAILEPCHLALDRLGRSIPIHLAGAPVQSDLCRDQDTIPTTVLGNGLPTSSSDFPNP